MRSDGAVLVYPVGHYLGAFHPDFDEPASHHAVRIGWETVRLRDEDELTVWGLAHGVPSEHGDQPWTRDDLLARAAASGVADPAAVLAGLTGAGAVVEVARAGDGSPGAASGYDPEGFARSHRLLPLLVGLGEDPDDPRGGIGLPGLTVALRATPRVFELWQWAHLWPDLWTACQALAEVAAELDQPAGESDPERVVEFALGAAQALIGHGAAYLDTRRRPAPGR